MQRGQKTSKSSRSSQPRGGASSAPPKRKNKGAQRVSVKQSSIGAAVSSRPVRIGMADLVAHRVSWVTGYTYVGDGTLGATDSVFFRPAGLVTNVVNGATGGNGQVPVLGADTTLGQSYLSDLEKHFSRKRIRECRLHLVPMLPGTSNSAIVYAAPVRGPGASGDTVTVTTATAAPTVANTLGMSGVIAAASWEARTLDLTPYIAGGSGAKQNEFAISRDGDDASTAWGAGSMDLDLIAPCGFVISGNNGTAALRGFNLHVVVIEQVIDLLDFLGGNSLGVPLSFTVPRLMSLLKPLGLRNVDLETIDAMLKREEDKRAQLSMRR